MSVHLKRNREGEAWKPSKLKSATETCSTIQLGVISNLSYGKQLLTKDLYDSWTFMASPDELAVDFLQRVLTVATPVLCDYVTQRMKRRFGEGKWFHTLLEGMGRSRLRPRLEKHPRSNTTFILSPKRI